MVHQLFEKQAEIERQLAEITSCKQCVKAMYKKLKPTLDRTPLLKTPKQLLATPTGRCLPVCSPQQTPSQTGSEEAETRVEPMEDDIQLDTPMQETEELEAIENTDCGY
ncbi:uncharacterized protein LOC110451292 [Mizuhopecten yessoensis]|uniref:uncharacterized protein LOC110451292 n=1 Tax=Mizuhopecten yessoensis TaxID=6573 RepID=UPI000B45D253|nr:uncharacterized protein LOC110451292 [Mizuhopecten yessoensis]